MLRQVVLIFTVLWMPVAIFAQSPDSLWSHTYGTAGVENSFSLVQTGDDGHALAGWKLPYGSSQYDFWLVRADANGDSLWSRTYGGQQGDYCYAICTTTDGGFALGGYTESLALGLTDAWLIKTDAAGNEQWNRRYGGIGFDWCLDLQQNSDGGYVMAGWTDPLQLGIGNGWLSRLNSSGDTLWSRSYGGVGEDRFYAVERATDGGFVCAGRTSSSGGGGLDVWLFKATANGATQWSRTYGGAGHDRCYAMDQTADGGFICAGSTESFGAGGEDAWLLRVNANGDTLWSRTLGGAQADRAWSVEQVMDGGFTVAGQTASSGAGGEDFWIAHVDDSGNVEWSRTLGGPGTDICYEAVQGSDGSYALAGQTASFGSGADDMWLVKLSAAGELIAPTELVIQVIGSDVQLSWNPDANPFYRVYSDASSEGNFGTLIGSTADTTMVILNGAQASARLFYHVVGTTTP